MFLKVNNQQRKLVGGWVKVNGSWRTLTEVSGKVNNVWKPGWKNAFPKPTVLTYPTTIRRGEKITWAVGEVVGAHYELQFRYNKGTWSASTFSSALTGTYTISTNTANGTFQIRVRAVAPTTRDKQSAWLEGPTRNLTPQKLDAAAPTYTTDITRGEKVKVTIKTPNADKDTKYNLDVVYYEGTKEVASNLWDGVNTGKTTKVIEHTVSASTKYNAVRYRLKVSKTGYYESDWAIGTKVTLGKQKLGTVSSITAPTPYPGQTVSITWTAVNNANNYQLEVQYNDATWTRVQWNPNRTYNLKAPDKKSIQWRVRATNSEYIDGDWKYSTQSNLKEKPLKTTTWKATKTLSWRDAYGGWRDDNNYVYQGSWDDGNNWGNHRGLAWFDDASMKKTLAGAKIERVRIYFYRINKGGIVANQKINLHTHNYAKSYTGKPTTLYHIQGPFSSFDRAEGKWVTVDKEIAERIRDDKATGIALYTGNEQNYLYMSSDVRIEVQYR